MIIIILMVIIIKIIIIIVKVNNIDKFMYITSLSSFIYWAFIQCPNFLLVLIKMLIDNQGFGSV